MAEIISFQESKKHMSDEINRLMGEQEQAFADMADTPDIGPAPTMEEALNEVHQMLGISKRNQEIHELNKKLHQTEEIQHFEIEDDFN